MTFEMWSLPMLRAMSVLSAGGEVTGYDVFRRTGVPRGTVHGILERFEQGGLATSRAEKVSGHLSGQRPPRVFFQLTSAGFDELAALRQLVST